MSEIIELSTTLATLYAEIGDQCYLLNDGPSSCRRGQTTQFIRHFDGDLFAERSTWGYVPYWRNDAERPIYYAAGETITRKGTVSRAFQHARCIVPATSFIYEREIDGSTVHFTVTPKQGDVLLLAGIYEPSVPRYGGGHHQTMALVTKAAHDTLLYPLGQVPLCLKKEQVMTWLRVSTNMAVVKQLVALNSADNLALRTSIVRGAGCLGKICYAEPIAISLMS